MRRPRLRRFLALGLLLSTQSCGLMLLSAEEEISLGLQAYPQATAKHPQITSGPEYRMLQKVMRRIVPHARPAVESWAQKDFEWEVRLLDAPKSINAWCLPGGKMAFYTGILPVCQGEAGVAVVMSHEIAHAVLRHGNQRISQRQLIGAGMVVAALLLDEDDEEDKERNEMIFAALGIGASLGLILPYSREHETEADVYGLELMVQAGYDPWEAVRLWERMAKLGSSSLEFLSTHPNPGNRARHLAGMIPEIQARYGRPITRPPGR